MWWAAAVNYLSQPPKGGTRYQVAPASAVGMGIGSAALIAGGILLLAVAFKKG